MSRSVLFAALLAVTMTGCASVNPAGSSVATGSGFDTKLLNLFSVGSQSASQVNYVPNTQLNQAMQSVTTNTAAIFPIASTVGSGGATAANATAQTLVNNVTQNQNQNQLVL